MLSEFCEFCQIVEGHSFVEKVELPFQKEVNTPVLAFRPKNPVVPEHVLFIPGVHVAHAADSPDATADVMWVAAKYAQLRLEPFNLITSAGRPATQTMFHLHIHYVPRNETDGLLLPWSDPTKLGWVLELAEKA